MKIEKALKRVEKITPEVSVVAEKFVTMDVRRDVPTSLLRRADVDAMCRNGAEWVAKNMPTEAFLLTMEDGNRDAVYTAVDVDDETGEVFLVSLMVIGKVFSPVIVVVEYGDGVDLKISSYGDEEVEEDYLKVAGRGAVQMFLVDQYVKGMESE